MQSESSLREWLNPPWDCGQSRKPRLSEFENPPKTLWHTKLLCCSNPVMAQPQFSKPDWPWPQIPSRKSQQSNNFQPPLANHSIYPFRICYCFCLCRMTKCLIRKCTIESGYVSVTSMYKRVMEWQWHIEYRWQPHPGQEWDSERTCLAGSDDRRCSPTYILQRGGSEKTSQSCLGPAISFI